MDYDVPTDVYKKEWWDYVECPSTMKDQYFGFELCEDDFKGAEEFFKNQTEIINRHNRFQYLPSEGKMLSVDTGYSKVINTEKEFEVNLTMKPFNKNDIEVVCSQGFLIIRGEHPIVGEGKGEVSRKFERQYVLPKNCDPNSLKLDASSDDILVVKCLKTETNSKIILSVS